MKQVHVVPGILCRLHDVSPHYGYLREVISRAFFLFFPCNHIINIKKKSFSGEVKDSVTFPFSFLLHKLHKPIHLYPLSKAFKNNFSQFKIKKIIYTIICYV